MGRGISESFFDGLANPPLEGSGQMGIGNPIIDIDRGMGEMREALLIGIEVADLLLPVIKGNVIGVSENRERRWDIGRRIIA